MVLPYVYNDYPKSIYSEYSDRSCNGIGKSLTLLIMADLDMSEATIENSYDYEVSSSDSMFSEPFPLKR